MSATEECFSVDLNGLSINMFELSTAAFRRFADDRARMPKMAASAPTCTGCCTSNSCRA